MHWNHRIIRHVERKAEEENDYIWFGVHEVHYDDDDSDAHPIACTEKPVELEGESHDDIHALLNRAANALGRPVLEYDDFLFAELTADDE